MIQKKTKEVYVVDGVEYKDLKTAQEAAALPIVGKVFGKVFDGFFTEVRMDRCAFEGLIAAQIIAHASELQAALEVGEPKFVVREGKRYRMYNGNVTDEMERTEDSVYVWSDGRDTWTADGQWCVGEENSADLIEELP